VPEIEIFEAGSSRKVSHLEENRLTCLEQLQVQVAAAAATDTAAAGIVAARMMMDSVSFLQRPGGVALELLQEAVDLVLDTGG